MHCLHLPILHQVVQQGFIYVITEVIKKTLFDLIAALALLVF
jgi:hypothetical protein